MEWTKTISSAEVEVEQMGKTRAPCDKEKPKFKPARNQLPREHFETAEARKKHLGGGFVSWWHMGKRQSLGYREGVWTSSWYARVIRENRKKICVRFAEADNEVEADGVVVLSFEQAINEAKRICGQIAQNPNAYTCPPGPYRPLPSLPPRDPFLVAHAVMDYYDRQNTLGKSIKADMSVIRISILPHLGHIEAKLLTTKEIRDWMEVLVRTPPRLPSPRNDRISFVRLTHDVRSRDRRIGAANRALRILKAAMQLAFENGHCESDNPWRRVKNIRRLPPQPPRYLERDEILRLVEVLPEDLKKLVIAALVSGCRANELLKLKVKDYRKSQRRLIVTDDKTRKTRHVTMSLEGKEFFDRLTDNRHKDDTMLKRNDGSAWPAGSYLYRLHRFCNEVGISPVIGLHDLRRTFASHAVMAGVPMHVVSKQLGHSRVEITERSYLHLSVTYIDDIFVEKMPSLVSGERPWHLDVDMNGPG